MKSSAARIAWVLVLAIGCGRQRAGDDDDDSATPDAGEPRPDAGDDPTSSDAGADAGSTTYDHGLEGTVELRVVDRDSGEEECVRAAVFDEAVDMDGSVEVRSFPDEDGPGVYEPDLTVSFWFSTGGTAELAIPRASFGLWDPAAEGDERAPVGDAWTLDVMPARLSVDLGSDCEAQDGETYQVSYEGETAYEGREIVDVEVFELSLEDFEEGGVDGLEDPCRLELPPDQTCVTSFGTVRVVARAELVDRRWGETMYDEIEDRDVTVTIDLRVPAAWSRTELH